MVKLLMGLTVYTDLRICTMSHQSERINVLFFFILIFRDWAQPASQNELPEKSANKSQVGLVDLAIININNVMLAEIFFLSKSSLKKVWRFFYHHYNAQSTFYLLQYHCDIFIRIQDNSWGKY